MRHKILAVGKLRERYIKEGVADYTKRLRPYGAVEMIEVAPEKAIGMQTSAEELELKQKEGERLLKNVKSEDYVVVLDEKGKTLTSEELSAKISRLALQGTGCITWVIGGHLGHSREVLDRADRRLSLSGFTFPHQLVRLILLEQLYRAAKISAGEPYHR